jgi:hypothetical protein
MPTPEELAAQAAAPATPTPNSETGNAPGDTDKTPVVEKSGEKLFTQADLERQIDDRLKRERAKNEAAAAKAAKEAEEQQAIRQGEYQKLAEDRKAQLEQLAPKAELADRLSEIVAKQLETEIAAWPESVRAIMPAEDSPLLERITWAERTRPLAQELMAAQGSNAAPPPMPGLRFPAQHPGGAMAPSTTKAVAESYVAKTYARPKRE